MSKIAIILSSVLALLAVFALVKTNSSQAVKVQTHTELLRVQNPFTLPQCTQKLAIECGVDIVATVVACSAAFSEQGANIIADIACAKDLLSDRKHCWPCICFEAQKREWKIIGC